jgi:hypothetical protein
MQRHHTQLVAQMAALAIVARRARGDDVVPGIQSAARDRNDVIARKEFAAAQLSAVTTTILTTVTVAGEEERVGNLAAELAGDVNESFQADDGWTGECAFLGVENATIIDFEYFGFLVNDEPQRPFYREYRERLERRIQRKNAHPKQPHSTFGENGGTAI